MPKILQADITDYIKEVTIDFEFNGEKTTCIWRRDLEGTEVFWNPKKPQWAKDMQTEYKLDDYLNEVVDGV